jgi:uncharacterized protein
MATTELEARLGVAGAVIRRHRKVLVAYSGGVDSSLVLELAYRALGEGCIGVIARSPSLPAAELEAALAAAAARDIAVRVLDTHEVERDDYARNQPDRCYFCKLELYSAMRSLAVELDAEAVLDGFNHDDRRDWRPGRRAAQEVGVVSPLDAAGMTKADVREAARGLGLRVWDKPAAACLSSRIAYGIPVTIDRLRRVEAAEIAVRAAGFVQVRVRDRGGAATIEVEPREVARLQEAPLRTRLEASLVALGYSAVTIDADGYRPGNLNSAAGDGVFQAEEK